jgi:hypothetical protein
MAEFNRVEYACDGRPILALNTYPVEMALIAIERFVVKVLVKNLPEWQETQDAVELHAHGLRYGNEGPPEKQLVLSGTALQLMEAEELESWRRLGDRLGKAMEVEHTAFGCWLDRLKSIR